MGHQFARTSLAAAVALTIGACGAGDGEADPPPVLENAREQVAANDPVGASTAPPSDSGSGSTGTAPPELPPPDPSTFEGANRIVNLWVGPEGETVSVDVWGRRTFTNGPILLAENVGFGGASEYFSAPPGHDLVVVGSGAGPDGDERAGMFNATAGEQITVVFTNDDDQGGVAASNLFERGDQAPAPPADGTGVIALVAPNVRAYSEALIATIGGDAFYVGDGSSTCRSQRVEADGFPPEILGGTQRVELELTPGPATISLHPWFSPDACDQPPVLNLTVEVTAGSETLVLVYSRDGESIEALTLPVAAPTG